jgi:hypothetical protein
VKSKGDIALNKSITYSLTTTEKFTLSPLPLRSPATEKENGWQIGKCVSAWIEPKYTKGHHNVKKKMLDFLRNSFYIHYTTSEKPMKPNRRYIALIIAIVALSGIALAGAYLEAFTAKSIDDNIVLEWKTGDESSVKQFDIERTSGGMVDFVTIGSLTATGNNSYYKFIDRSAYKSSDVIYKYRLKIVDRDPNVPPTYSNQISVSHTTSSVKRTWGSIKAMFR